MSVEAHSVTRGVGVGVGTGSGSDAMAQEVTGLVLEQTRRFLAREVDPAAIEAAGRIPERVLGAAASAGLFGLTVPEAYGGIGLSLADACRVIAEVANVDGSVAVTLGLHAGLGTRPLVEFGSAAARARYLPALACGERIASFAATEPCAGSDLTAVRTVLELDAGGGASSGGALSGEKCFVTNGGFAGLYTVLARSPGAGGRRAHSLVCVPREAGGLEVGAEEHKLGLRGSSTVSLRFERVAVPDEGVLREPGAGMAQAHAALCWGRTLMAAGCVGTARGALAAAGDYARARRQFGRALTDFAAVRARLADCAGLLYAMEALVDDAARAVGAGEGGEKLSLCAKVFCSEAAFEVCDAAVQLHGGMGFIESAGVARRLRDCRVTRIFEGANDVLLVRAGAALALGPRGGDDPEGCDGAGEAERACAALGAAVERAAARAQREHGLALVHRQLVLQGLARAWVLHAAARAALARAAAAEGGGARAVAEHAAELLCQRARGCLADAAHGAEEERRADEVFARVFGPAATSGAEKAVRS